MEYLLKKGITLRSILYYIFLFGVISLFIGYALFQARFLLAGPVITFENLPSTVQEERLVLLEGNAQNIVRMTLNGRQIYTDKNGYFKEVLILENGYTITTLQVHDRYGRSRSYVQEFVYIPPGTY